MLAGGASPAWAQAAAPQPPVPPVADPTTDDPLRFDNTVTVTGTRSEVTTDRSPVPVSVVPASELRLRNAPSIDRALDLLSGVFVFRTRGTADPFSRVMMRGFNGPNRTLVLLDGQPINDGYAGDVTWTSLPTGEVDRVEVARGPYSALYGGNAMGGVINILTRPIASRQFQGMAQGGTDDTRQLSVHVGDRFGAVGISGGYQRFQTDGYESREITVAPAAAGTGTPVTGAIATLSPTGTAAFIIGNAGRNRYDQDAVRGKVEWTPNGRTSLSAQYLYQRSAYAYVDPSSLLRDASGAAVTTGAVLFQDGDVLRRATLTPATFLQGPGDDHSHLLNAALHRKMGNHLLRVSGNWYRQPAATTQTPNATSATFTGGPGAIAVRDSRTQSFSVQDDWPLTRHLVTIGVDYRAERSDNEEFALSDWTQVDARQNKTFDSTGKTQTLAAYIQDQWSAGDRLTIVAGARADRWVTSDGAVNIFNAAVPPAAYDDRTTASVTAKTSITFRPTAAWTVRGSVGSAFRNPTVFELYRTFRLSTGTLFAANPDLQPERLLGAEAGLSRQWGARGSLDVTYFRNHITDLIYRKTDLAADPSGRFRILVNAGEGRTDGLEVSASHRVIPAVLARASYTFTDAIIARNPALPETEGKQVPNIPRHMGSVAVFLAKGRWTGSATGRYASGTFSLDTNLDTTKGVPGSYSPYFVAAASVTANVGKGVELFTSVENLFDRRYYTFYLNPGRTLAVGARVKLGN